MPRGRKKKVKFNLNIKPETAKSLFAIGLLLVSALCLISFFAKDYVVNSKIQTFLSNAFGSLSIMVPFVLAFVALFFIDSIKLKFKQMRVLIGVIGLLAFLPSILHIFYSGSNALQLAQKGFGGGMVGYFISNTLISIISVYGAFLVVITGIAISLILIFNISLEQIASWLGIVKNNLSFIKLPSLKKAKKPLIHDAIEISNDINPSFTSNDSNDVDDKSHKKDKKKDKQESKFEIIPSLSEPLASSDIVDPLSISSLAGQVTTLNTISGLPYTDKVWETPSTDLLIDGPNIKPDTGDVVARAKTIKDTLKSFGITVDVAEIQSGPAVTQYALEADSGTKISKIANLQFDLALALASPTGSVRIEAPIPGKSLIGIEVPNNTRTNVSFKSIFISDQMKGVKSKLGIVLGKDVSGTSRVYDIGKMPHLLVAGATGSGKSVFLHSLIFSLLYRASPQEVNFIMMDPKRTELVNYNDIPHLISPVVTDVDKAPAAFKWAVNEMMRRYKLFEAAKARNIEGYNEKSGFQALPYIVIVVDELAEIMIVDPASVEKNIIRIAQLARATGIHLVLAVQRPSTNIITGLIKANIPSRIAFNVASQIDSRVIIDQPGAEKLLGKGDMLFVPPDVQKPIRIQGAYVTDKEISNLVDYLKAQGVRPEYKPEILEANDRTNKSIAAGGDDLDEYFNEAKDIVISTGKASTSFLQRRLAIGYARAARIIDELEQKGVIGPPSGSKAREIYAKGPANDMGINDADFDNSNDFDPKESAF